MFQVKLFINSDLLAHLYSSGDQVTGFKLIYKYACEIYESSENQIE